MNFFSANRSLSGYIAGITLISSTILIQQSVYAKTSQEIARIAESITVQINNSVGVLGGSGFIIGKQGNTYTVLTAHHVVNHGEDAEYSVQMPDGKIYHANVIHRFQRTASDPDLAIVSFSAQQQYPVATLGDSNQTVIGSDIYVSGYPLPVAQSQREYRFTNGIVTSRPERRSGGYTLRYNAPTGTGMSGGPVLDGNGRVIGIHGQGDADGEVTLSTGEIAIVKTGINSAIPINTFTSLYASISEVDLVIDRSSTGENSANRLNNPQTARDFYARGIVRSDQGNIAGAISDLTEAISRDTGSSLVYRDRAIARLKSLGETDVEFEDRANRNTLTTILEDLNKAISLDQRDAISYYNRGQVRFFLGEKQAGIEDLNQAIRLDPYDSRAYVSRSFIHSKRGQDRQALNDAIRAVELDPSNAQAWAVRGSARHSLKDHRGAIDDYNQALRINPNDPVVYNNRAIARHWLKDREGALRDLQIASDLALQQGRMSLYEVLQDNLRKARRYRDCYIATATIQGGGSEEQLNILRGWRDEILTGNYIGDMLLSIYDRIGPKVVDLIVKNLDLGEIFLYGFILPALSLIEFRNKITFNSKLRLTLDYLIYLIFLMVLSYALCLYTFNFSMFGKSTKNRSFIKSL